MVHRFQELDNYDDYDPTPYKGGYDQEATYGSVKPADEESGYRRADFGEDEEEQEVAYGDESNPYEQGHPGPSIFGGHPTPGGVYGGGRDRIRPGPDEAQPDEGFEYGAEEGQYGGYGGGYGGRRKYGDEEETEGGGYGGRRKYGDEEETEGGGYGGRRKYGDLEETDEGGYGGRRRYGEEETDEGGYGRQRRDDGEEGGEEGGYRSRRNDEDEEPQERKAWW